MRIDCFICRWLLTSPHTKSSCVIYKEMYSSKRGVLLIGSWELKTYLLFNIKLRLFTQRRWNWHSLEIHHFLLIVLKIEDISFDRDERDIETVPSFLSHYRLRNCYKFKQLQISGVFTQHEADFLKQYLNNVKQRNSTNVNLSPSVAN